LLALAGCAQPAGQAVKAIAEPDIAAAYLPLTGREHLGIDRIAGAAMVIAPGIAVTNAHNYNLIDPKSVIGQSRDYDLLFFRSQGTVVPASAAPAADMKVTAYGEAPGGGLRLAHGVVREIHACDGCGPAPAYFTFAANAGPGFSGGPVVDGQGRLIGITFGFKDQGKERLIFAYDLGRVMAELKRLGPTGPPN